MNKKPENFYKKEFYVEYNINENLEGRFISKIKLNKLKKFVWIKIKKIRQLKFDNLLNDYFYKEIVNE